MMIDHQLESSADTERFRCPQGTFLLRQTGTRDALHTA